MVTISASWGASLIIMIIKVNLWWSVPCTQQESWRISESNLFISSLRVIRFSFRPLLIITALVNCNFAKRSNYPFKIILNYFHEYFNTIILSNYALSNAFIKSDFSGSHLFYYLLFSHTPTLMSSFLRAFGILSGRWQISV